MSDFMSAPLSSSSSSTLNRQPSTSSSSTPLLLSNYTKSLVGNEPPPKVIKNSNDINKKPSSEIDRSIPPPPIIEPLVEEEEDVHNISLEDGEVRSSVEEEAPSLFDETFHSISCTYSNRVICKSTIPSVMAEQNIQAVVNLTKPTDCKFLWKFDGCQAIIEFDNIFNAIHFKNNGPEEFRKITNGSNLEIIFDDTTSFIHKDKFIIDNQIALTGIIMFNYNIKSDIHSPPSYELKDISLCCDNKVYQLVKVNFVRNLQNIMKSSLSTFRSKYGTNVLLFTSTKDLFVFVQWLKQNKTLVNFINVIKEIAVLPNKYLPPPSTLENHSLIIKNTITYGSFCHFILKTSLQELRNLHGSSTSKIEESLNAMRLKTSGQVAVAFKYLVLSKNNFALTQIGTSFSEFDGSKLIQYSIKPENAPENICGYQLINGQLQHTYQPRSLNNYNYENYETVNVVVKSEREAILSMMQDIAKFINDRGFSGVMMLFHSVFTSLPILLSSLNKHDQLDSFYRLVNGIFDLRDLYPSSVDKHKYFVPGLYDIHLNYPPNIIDNPANFLAGCINYESTRLATGYHSVSVSDIYLPKKKCYQPIYYNMLAKGEKLNYSSLKEFESTENLLFIPFNNGPPKIDLIYGPDGIKFQLKPQNNNLLLGHLISDPSTTLCPLDIMFLSYSGTLKCSIERIKKLSETLIGNLYSTEISYKGGPPVLIKPFEVSKPASIFFVALKVNPNTDRVIQLSSVNLKKTTKVTVHNYDDSTVELRKLRGYSFKDTTTFYYNSYDQKCTPVSKKSIECFNKKVYTWSWPILVGFNIIPIVKELTKANGNKTFREYTGICDLKMDIRRSLRSTRFELEGVRFDYFGKKYPRTGRIERNCRNFERSHS